MKTWHIITCEYPPQIGGVSDYTRLLARELHRAGDDVHVWAPSLGTEGLHEAGAVVHRSLGDFSRAPLERTRELIAGIPSEDAELLVQWVPHGYGYRSMNIGFCNWLRRMAREGIPISLMVHEPCLESRGSLKQRMVALVHRRMVRKLLRCASRVFMSIPAWESYLRRLAADDMEFEWLPIPATLPPLGNAAAASQIRRHLGGSHLIGHLSTYGKETSSLLAPVIVEILEAVPGCNFLLLGSGSEAFRTKLLQQFPQLSTRLHAGGVLSEEELSHHLSACDLMLQPYIDGLSTRRTSVMNALSLGVSLVTNTGHLTEEFWLKSDAVSLGLTTDLPQRCIALLYDKDKRDELAMRGAALYSEHFDWPRVVSKLRQHTLEDVSPVSPTLSHSLSNRRACMRIAVVNRSRRKVGGVEVYLDTVIPALAQAGHEIAYLYECDQLQDRELITLPCSAPQWHVAEIGANETLRQLRGWKPDICFTHGLSDVSLERVIGGLAPSILYVHNYYGTCISGNKAIMRNSFTPCDRRFGPSCILHYFPDRCGGSNPLTMLSRYRLQSKRLQLMRRYSALIGDSEHMTREMTRHGLDAECLNYPLIPPVTTATPASRDRGPWRLIFVGRTTTLKGGQHLLTALPEIQQRLGRKLHVLIAGDGPERKQWEKLATGVRSSSIEIEFHGWLNKEELNGILSASHLLVYPSVWPEPFGLSGLEAGFFGVPAVAFPVGGIPEWLHDGVNGQLAELPVGPQSLADAIVRALADPVHHARLCKGAQAESARYTLDRHLDQLIRIFERCVT